MNKSNKAEQTTVTKRSKQKAKQMTGSQAKQTTGKQQSKESKLRKQMYFAVGNSREKPAQLIGPVHWVPCGLAPMETTQEIV
jgi:hypothetical protein